MGNYYEINVALNGRHFFATSNRSITSADELVKVMDIFREKFPKDEGYELRVTHWKTVGEIINPVY